MDARMIGNEPGTRVTVEVDWNVIEGSLEAELLDSADLTEGAEDLRAWCTGAMHGARHALDVACALPCRLRITEIYGELDQTNPTIVAAACAHAVWEAIGYRPSVEQVQLLDREVAASMTTGAGTLPAFGR
ncbi:MAG: hypothetical protein ACI8QZ_001689 [Chlamydiales bacterium]|jgi:hypothetical protein